jgi:hypothetical protein
MKHHGQYETIENVEDFKVLLGEHFEESDEVKAFVQTEIRKAKQKYSNGKRHLDKQKTKRKRLR